MMITAAGASRDAVPLCSSGIRDGAMKVRVAIIFLRRVAAIRLHFRWLYYIGAFLGIPAQWQSMQGRLYSVDGSEVHGIL